MAPARAEPAILAVTTKTSVARPSASGSVAAVTMMMLPVLWNSAAVFAAGDDPVVQGGGNQQRHRAQHEDERHPVQITRMRRQPVVAILEDASELEADENLRAEDENARLVQRRLRLLAEVHRLRPA